MDHVPYAFGSAACPPFNVATNEQQRVPISNGGRFREEVAISEAWRGPPRSRKALWHQGAVKRSDFSRSFLSPVTDVKPSKRCSTVGCDVMLL